MGALKVVGLPYLSPSAMATLTACERKYWHAYGPMKLKEPSSEPLAMGSGMATALEFGNLAAGLYDYLDSRPALDDLDDPQVYERQGRVAQGIITRAYEGYTTRWPDRVPGLPPVEREATYLISVGSGNLQVRVDGVTPAHLIEDKLRSGSAMKESKLENERRQGRQLTAEIYGYWRDKGAILPVHLRCVKKPDPRPLRTCDEEDIGGLLDDHFAKDTTFVELVCERSEAQLLAFERELEDIFVRAARIKGSTTPVGQRNTEACDAFGRACPALGYCQGMTPYPTPEEATTAS